MDFKNWIITEDKKNLDEIGYGRTTEERYLRNAPTPFFGSEWKKWKLKSNPKNSSKTTSKELKKINDKHHRLTTEQKKVIHRQDRYDPEVEFFDLLRSLGEKLSKKDKQKITQIMKELTTISLFFKEHFDRPRPHQIINKVHPQFKPLKTKTGSASYPSGHALIGEFLGLYLSDKYPKHRKELRNFGKELGWNRVLGGFHFPSDFKSGVNLARKLYKLKKS